MNTFKTVLVICAMLGASASCSSSYQSAVSQASQTAEATGDFHGGVIGGGGGQSSAYVSQPVVPNSPAAFEAEQQRPAESAGSLFGAEKVRPVIAAAAAAAAATAKTTQYICSCITINPVATVTPHQVPTGDSFGQAAAQQQTFASQQGQQQQQQQSIVGPASSQSVPIQQQQSAGDHRGHY